MDGVVHPALSDGTLRFLALAVLDLDPETTGLLCLEEPENGIHHDRIPAVLEFELLRDIAMDVKEPVGPGNPLRQVIVNTHSPSVVSEMLEDDVLIASLGATGQGGSAGQSLSFACLPGTWRDRAAGVPTAPPGILLPYLRPIVFGKAADATRRDERNRRVADAVSDLR